MGKCIQCGGETEHMAQVFIGTPLYDSVSRTTSYRYREKSEYFCESCVRSQMDRNYTGILFYACLQLCWFTVARYGLRSVFGWLGMLFALFGLFRMAVFLLRKLYRRLHPARELPQLLRSSESLDDEASEFLRRKIIQQEKKNNSGKRVLNRKEYYTTHRKERPTGSGS